jgi:Alr-MurF fusion protein
MSDRLVIAEIDLGAYEDNLQKIRSRLTSETKLMAVVKANAYGHGAIELAKAAERAGAAYLGVVCLYEARQLRDAGISLPILILNYIDHASALEAIDLDCDVTVMDEEVIRGVGNSGKKSRLHLKVDTGMHRAGADPAQILTLAQTIQSFPNLEFHGLFTHFANADDADLSFAKVQLNVFKKVVTELENNGIRPPLIHAANSAATLCLSESHFDMVRPGICTYGLTPFSQTHLQNSQFLQEFAPVLSLKTQIIRIHEIVPGETVGYGRTFKATRPTRVGLLPVGYADGFTRSPSNWGEVLVGGKRAPVIGRVSMDQSSIDLTDIPEAQTHDEVILLGEQMNEKITADDIAARVGTINYEVVTRLTSRISRVYKENV